jgi:nickel transport protein
MCRLSRLCLPVLVCACVLSGTARAHKLKVFAAGEGRVISGYVYFPGGGRARGLTVVALAPDGAAAGQAVTDDGGEFTIPITQRADYTLVAQSPDGHRAEFAVRAEELASDLPAADHGARRPQAEPPAPTTDNGELEAIIERAVREQVRPLREQIEAYEERVRFRDVIAGIGYIVGLAGISFYFLGVRKRPTGPGGA